MDSEKVKEFERVLTEKVKEKLGESFTVTKSFAGSRRLYYTGKGKLVGAYDEIEGNVEAAIYI